MFSYLGHKESQVHPQQTKQVHDTCVNDEYIKGWKSGRNDWMQRWVSNFNCFVVVSDLIPHFCYHDLTFLKKLQVWNAQIYLNKLIWAINKFSANKSYSTNEHFHGQIIIQRNRCAQFTCFFKDRCAWKWHFWMCAQHESESEGKEVDNGSSYRQTQ